MRLQSETNASISLCWSLLISEITPEWCIIMHCNASNEKCKIPTVKDFQNFAFNCLDGRGEGGTLTYVISGYFNLAFQLHFLILIEENTKSDKTGQKGIVKKIAT